ncbi:MAG: hypothetical protein C0599_17060 [Salinivirgaceae bacterium]|nr:MAG: hypothetical protein C0599_17060 [Salinivirgaceae bacterium]
MLKDKLPGLSNEKIKAMRKLTLFIFMISAYLAYGQNSLNRENSLDQAVQEVNQDSIESYMRKLESFGTRYTFADNRKEVALWIKGKFESFGYTDVFLDSLVSESDISGEEMTIYNVICRSDNLYSVDDYGLIGAHHDATLYNFSYVMDSAPGADDNASGTAGVLEIARVYKQYYDGALPLHFATWTGEETGILGSESYVERYSEMDSLPLFYVNLDMIANQTSASSQMNYYYDDLFSHTYQYIEQYTDIGIHHLYISQAAGDNWPFDDAGVPFVYFQEYDFSENYHSLSDLVDSLEMPFAHKMVKGALAVTWNICGAFPDIEYTGFSYDGNGTDFTLKWSTVDNVAYYQIKVYQDEQLLATMNTTEDTMHITGMPLNSDLRVTLQKTTNDSVKGLVHTRYIELNDQPPVFELTPAMELTSISIVWDGIKPSDLYEYVLQRRLDGTEEWETVESFNIEVMETNIENHPAGIWEYSLIVKDTQGYETRSETCFAYSTETKNHIMFVSGQLGGYGNPTHADVFSFYENILPKKDSHLFIASIDRKYLPIMQNMEAVIWNAFSSNNSQFYENLKLIKPYLQNGGKVLLFGKNPQLHLDAEYINNISYSNNSWVDSLGVDSIIVNDGARLKQILHTSGLSANVDPDKLSASFNGSMPNFDVFELNENATPVLTYQSLSDVAPENNSDGEVIAMKHDFEEGVLVACGVPLYYFYEDESEVLLKTLLEDEMMVGVQSSEPRVSELFVYPSPANDVIYLEMPSNQSFTGNCFIYDVTGKMVMSKELKISNNQKVELPVHFLETGVYVLQLNGNESYSGRFIKE